MFLCRRLVFENSCVNKRVLFIRYIWLIYICHAHTGCSSHSILRCIKFTMCKLDIFKISFEWLTANAHWGCKVVPLLCYIKDHTKSIVILCQNGSSVYLKSVRFLWANSDKSCGYRNFFFVFQSKMCWCLAGQHLNWKLFWRLQKNLTTTLKCYGVQELYRFWQWMSLKFHLISKTTKRGKREAALGHQSPKAPGISGSTYELIHNWYRTKARHGNVV